MGCCHNPEMTVTEDNRLLGLELKQNWGQTPGKYQNFIKTLNSMYGRERAQTREERERASPP